MAATPPKIAHYQILEELGKGGMGIVYKANDEKLDRLVAIKILAPETMGDEFSRTRFLREAQAAAKLNHPNIATIYAIDEVDDTIFIVMEYIAGQTLGELMDSRRLTLAEIFNLAIQIAEGLAEAHQKNIIHRDVKPDNIMISATNQVKIMDFGLAKIRGQSRLTQDNFSMGTIDYISPELISRDREIDPRSDIFSYGVVLYEMVAGILPFQGEHDWSILYAILNHDPLPLDAGKLKIPPSLVRLIQKCLKKNPDFRYQSVMDLISALKKIQAKTRQPKNSGRIPHLTSRISRIRLSLLAVGSLFILVVIASIISSIIKTSNEYNSEAVKFILKGNLPEARRCLQQALADDSTFSSAWSNLGLVYLYQGEIDSSIYFSRKALLFDAQNVNAYFTLARAYEQKNQLAEAIQIYLRAIELDSSAAPAYNEAAYLQIQLGEIQPAIVLLIKCLEKVPESPYHAYTYKNLGKAYLVQQNLPMALQSVQMSLALDSTLTEARDLLQEMMRQQGQISKSSGYTSK